MDIKKQSHILLEKMTRSMISDVLMPFAEEYIAKSENKIDDILLPFLGELERALIEAADNIDGIDND